MTIVKNVVIKDALIRWDLTDRKVFNQDAWNNKMGKEFFDTVDLSVDRIPKNFIKLLTEPDPPSDDSVISLNNTMDSLIGGTKFTRGEYVIELPLDEDLTIDRFESGERKMHDPIWREEAKRYFLKKVEEAAIFNIVYAGQAETRTIQSHWISTLRKIDRLDKEMIKNGFIADYGIYQYDSPDESSSSSDDEEINQAERPIILASDDELDLGTDLNSADMLEATNSSEALVDDHVLITSKSDSSKSLATSSRSQTDSFVTSDDADYAIIQNPPAADNSHSTQKITEKNENEAKSDGRFAKRSSMHYVKGRNGYDESRFWSRPCFEGYSRMVIGDSMVRSFARKRYVIAGNSITAFGGMTLLELALLLKRGSLPHRNLKEYKVRDNIISGKFHQQNSIKTSSKR